MKTDYKARQARLLGITGVDAIAIVPGANMEYFTGLHVHLSERPTMAIFSDNKLTFIMPELEVAKITARPDLEAQVIPWSDAEGYVDAFAEAVGVLKLQNAPLGVDGQTMRVFEYMAFEKAGAGNIRDVGQDLLNIRAIKMADEVDSIREAIRLSEQALHRLLDWVKPGMTERSIAAELKRLMQEAGSEGEAFNTTVLCGENTYLPHGIPGDGTLGENDLMLIDFGARLHDYPADITRTFGFGEVDTKLKEIYDVVLAANRAAVELVKPGVPCGEIDKAARDVITEAGYGEYFQHRTGHGLGLEVHELPQIASGVDAPLEQGMVFTIEPGVYVPGLGGVRIEDVIHVTENGAEVLTQFPRSLSTQE